MQNGAQRLLAKRRIRMGKSIALAALAVLLALVACVTEDTENPVVSIVMPVNGDTLAKGDIVIKTVATDNKSVTKVEFFVDGSLVGTDNVGGAADTFRYTWSDTAAQTAGAHALGAKAYDAAENTGNATTLNICIAGGGGGTGPTYHSGKIDQDETWWPSGNPHILESDVYTGQNVTLTIKPGCVVKFDADVELYCGYSEPGAIVAVGTADSTILFTSNIPTPSAGDWYEVGAFSKSMSTTTFAYCIFEYGGGSSSYGEFHVDGFDAKVSNCTVRKSGGAGVKVKGEGSFREFTGNTVTECAGYPLEIQADYARTIGNGNAFTGNGNDGILVAGDGVVTTGTWLHHDVPYVIAGDVFVGDDNNSPVLTIAPGTTIELQADLEFYVGYGHPGAIIAEGTADSMIVFTSAQSEPSPGDWYEVGVFSDATSSTGFEYCVFEYGGGNANYGNFHLDDVEIKMSNCMVRQSGSVGVKVAGEGSFSEFTGNTLTECEDYPLEMKAEYVRTVGSGNDFSGNTRDGILVDGDGVITTGTWLSHNAPYVLAGDVSVGDDNNNPVLTIAPGTTVKLQSNVEMYVGYGQPGGLIIDGTDSQITFTSSIEPPSPGNWYSIGFYSYSIDQNCKLINTKVEYGGGDYANVRIWDAIPEVRGDSIGHSAKWGIYLSGSEHPDKDSLLANNTFYDNADGDVGP
jgi:hypothetical protein